MYDRVKGDAAMAKAYEELELHQTESVQKDALLSGDDRSEYPGKGRRL